MHEKERGGAECRVQALAAVQNAFDMHPITQQLAPDVLEGWKAWAAD